MIHEFDKNGFIKTRDFFSELFETAKKDNFSGIQMISVCERELDSSGFFARISVHKVISRITKINEESTQIQAILEKIVSKYDSIIPIISKEDINPEEKAIVKQMIIILVDDLKEHSGDIATSNAIRYKSTNSTYAYTFLTEAIKSTEKLKHIP